VQYRIEFVDRDGNVIRELHADARSDSGAIGLVVDSDWPPHAVAIRVLDVDGRTVRFEIKAKEPPDEVVL
jgi:hypothetical protein